MVVIDIYDFKFIVGEFYCVGVFGDFMQYKYYKVVDGFVIFGLWEFVDIQYVYYVINWCIVIDQL